jgi:hypothetical protein
VDNRLCNQTYIITQRWPSCQAPGRKSIRGRRTFAARLKLRVNMFAERDLSVESPKLVRYTNA